VTLLVLVVLSATGYAVVALPRAGRAPAAFSIRVTPRDAEGTVYRGGATAYRTRVRWGAGVSGPVTLGVSGLPADTTGSFVSKTGSGGTVTPAHPRASLVVVVGETAPPGRYTLTITGRSGSRTRSTTTVLRIVRPPDHYMGLELVPRSVTVVPGGSADYVACLTRSRVPWTVTLRVGSPLPSGAVASFDPNPLPGGCSTLTVATAASTPSGRYLFTIRAIGTRYPIEAPATLVVAPATPPPTTPPPTSPPPVTAYTISGDAPTLYPGGSASPIDLTFHNPGTRTIVVTDVTVTVTGTSAGAACPATHFATTDFSYGSAGGVTVPAGQTVSLQDAGVDPEEWPTVRMLDAGNQDACEGAIVTLTYASGSRGYG
jgi:hypothetical protein